MENKVKQLGKMDADQKLVLVAGLVLETRNPRCC